MFWRINFLMMPTNLDDASWCRRGFQEEVGLVTLRGAGGEGRGRGPAWVIVLVSECSRGIKDTLGAIEKQSVMIITGGDLLRNCIWASLQPKRLRFKKPCLLVFLKAPATLKGEKGRGVEPSITVQIYIHKHTHTPYNSDLFYAHFLLQDFIFI